MSNRFDEKYDIRLAKYDEIPDVMRFIDDNWKKGHILATNRVFFEYEMVIDGAVNCLIAKNKESGSIEGVLGFLPCSNDKTKLDVWGVVWKTIPTAMPMLGMEMKKRLINTVGIRTELGVGANVSTSIPLLGRIFHYYTAKMKHYYRLADTDDYKIAVVRDRIIPNYTISSSISVARLESARDLDSFFDFSKVDHCIPYKNLWYYERRFYNHPIYAYDVWGLSDEKDKAVLVTRTQVCNGSTAVRIVDYLGEQSLLGEIGGFLDQLLVQNEYIDFYFDGFDEKYAIQAGMVEVSETNNIIPDHFNPYEQSNVDIYVDSSNNVDKCLFFKADGDQDRPNI